MAAFFYGDIQKGEADMKECNQCGKCCIHYSDGGLSVTDDEISFWEACRPEIAEYVKKGEIWFDPSTGERLTICPFLKQDDTSKKYGCSIYFDRPDDCKHYPVTVTQMVQDDCEMIEPEDLKDTKKAQITLDNIMIDSRPAYGKYS
jgi:Fe-S-cluster containining protein